MIFLYWALMQNLSVNPAVLSPPTLIQLFFVWQPLINKKLEHFLVPDMRHLSRSVSHSKEATRRDFILAYGVSQHSISITLGLDISHLWMFYSLNILL